MGRVERPAPPKRRRLLGSAGGILSICGSDDCEPDCFPRPSNVSRGPAARRSMAAAAERALDRARRAHGSTVALSPRARRIVLRRPEFASGATARAWTLPPAHELRLTLGAGIR